MKNISDIHGVRLFQEFKSALPVPTLFSLVFPGRELNPGRLRCRMGISCWP